MTSLAAGDGFRIAVLLPCHNQAGTIGSVVRGFAEALPDAAIYVFDNNSTDDTAREATRAGARVYREARPGKGSVVRRMFADVEADIYVLAEGDGTYDPADAPSLVNALITEHADMAVGLRSSVAGHAGGSFARRVLDGLYRRSIGASFIDVFSGYRAFTRRFVKSFPAISTGFDIDAELSIHAGQLMVPAAEIELTESVTPSRRAPRAAKDTLRVLRALAMLVKENKPFAFYAAIAALFWFVGLVVLAAAGWSSGLLPAMSLFVIGFVSAACGLVLESLGRTRVEQKRILFLTVPALGT